MTSFYPVAPYAAPTVSNSHAQHPVIFDGDEVVGALEEREFDLLLRTVELVVLSQAFSRAGLQNALRISVRDAVLMTQLLEEFGVIGAGEVDDQREVVAQLADLTIVVAVLHACRETAVTVQIAA